MFTLRTLRTLAFLFLSLGFVAAGQASAQTSGTTDGDLVSYHLNTAGQVDMFNVKVNETTTETIHVPTPTQAITDAVEAAHNHSVQVEWTQEEDDGPKNYTGMTVY